MTRRWRAVGATAALPCGAGRRTWRGFTLTEMLIVIGIIVLIVALAVPAFRAMTGGRSVDAAQNQLAAILGQARAEAIGLQKMRGVLFILDPATERVNAVLVEEGGRPEPGPTTAEEIPDVYLDAVPDRDPMPLPVGVGLQMVDNAEVTPGTGSNPVGTRRDDGYVGYNEVPAAGGTGPRVRVGGAILFDGSGRLVNKRYGFYTLRPRSRTVTQPTPTRLGELLGYRSPSTPPSFVVMPQFLSGSAPGSVAEDGRPPRSQLGFVLYDAEPFRNLNFTPDDPQFRQGAPYTGTETDEEKWLDQNATPVLVNRYNGTLVRGE